MRTWLVVPVVAALLWWPQAASADPPSKAEVRQLLSSFERGPEAGAWHDMGPQTVGVLVELYADGGEQPWVRLRAVRATSHFPIAAARTFLRTVVQTPRQSDLFVREGLLAMARAFGESAFSDLRPYLDDRRPVVREAAAMGLGRIGTGPAREALEQRLAVEDAASVRLTIERALARTPPRDSR